MRLSTLTVLALAILLAGGWAAAAAPSVSDLLEKGIYKEETAGDLAAAIRIYEQIVAESNANRTVAAQAHYRLALCHLKQGDERQARELLDTLKAKYPEEKELIARAQEQMPSGLRLEPTPWVDGELLELDMKLATGVTIGAVVLTADSAVADGRNIWRLELRRYVTVAENNQGVSRVDVEQDSFKPIRSHFRHGLLGVASTVYGEGRAEITAEKDGTKQPAQQLDLKGPVFDNEQFMHLMRRLPLEVGYNTPLTALTPTGQLLPFTLEVKQKESLTVPAGTFETYKVELSIGQTFWYSADRNRYLVKFEASGVAAELVRIGRRSDATAATLSNRELGFSFKPPADWLALEHPVSGRSDVTVVSLLDPAATATAVLELNKIGDERRTVQEIGKKELEGVQKRFTNYTLREDSWSERQISGRPALSFIGEYRNDDERWVQYRAYILGQDLQAEFVFKLPEDRLEAYRPAIEAILAGFQEN